MKLAYLIFLISLCVGVVVIDLPPQDTIQKPNVLLIMTDDQGWGDLRFHGNDSIDTPNLDKLAAEGIRFEHFYVSPVCAPSRASLLTGRYHLRTGTSWVTHRKEVMNAKEVTLAELFKTEGYRTGCFGKWHNGAQYPNDPIGQGFDEFFGFKAGHWNNYFNTTLIRQQEQVTTSGYITDVLTDEAISFLEIQQEPFLCYVPYNAPHSPFQVPDQYFDKYKARGLCDKNAAVYGMVENIDHNIGRLLATLDSQGILEETIVVFLTDNGPNGHRFNGGMRGIKGKVHEGGVRVPLFIYWKDHLPTSISIQQLAAHIDLLPTLADLCGLPLPDSLQLDGRSLVPLWEEPVGQWNERPIFNIHTEGEDRMWPAAIRTERYRLVIDYGGGKPQLFDMLQDPGQQVDIAEELPLLRDSLYEELTAWYQDVSNGAFDPAAIPVYQSAGKVEFPAPEAELIGTLSFAGGRGWANDFSINWQNQGDGLRWPLRVAESGTYEVWLRFAKNTEHPARFEIQTNVENLDALVKPQCWPEQLYSPDRVTRGEVYEKPRCEQALGTITIREKDQWLLLQLKDEFQGQLEVEQLTLVPVE